MSPATDPGRAAEGMQEVRYLRAVIDTLRQELVTERKLVKGFEADLIAARKERDEATRLLRVLNEETVLAGYPCGDRDRTLANLRALRSDLIALAKMYGEACGELARTRSWLDQADRYADACEENQRDASNLVAHLSRQRKAAEEEAAQLRARLHEAEKGREGSGRDPGGSGHPAEPEPASGLGPSDGCPSRDQAEADPPRRFREVLPEAYGWLVDADGYLWGLTAGDMGYDQTDMRLIDLFDLAVEAEWHRFNITGEKKWSVHTITLDFITTLAAALGIEARRAETLGSACESPAPTGAMPDPLTPAPEANQEAGDGR